MDGGFHFVPTKELTLGSLDSSGAPAADQLAQFQEQLVGVLLEKQQLESELKYVKEDQMRALMQQLSLERERSRELAERIKRAPKLAQRRARKPREGSMVKSKSLNELALRSGGEGTSFALIEEDEPEDDEDDDATERVPPRSPVRPRVEVPKTRMGRLVYNTTNWVQDKLVELQEDFSEVATITEDMEDPLGEPLNMFKLKKNLLRVGNLTDPILDMVKEVKALTRWENPPVSFLIFMVYMYSVYKGWVLTLVLLMTAFTFLLSYFRYKGFHVGTDHLRKWSSKEIERGLGMRDQIAILFHVSRMSMNHSGMGADLLERVKNILLWKDVELTKEIVMLLCMTLVASFFFPAHSLFTMAGLYMGVQAFIIDYIFYRFPRLKQKYDKASKLFERMATDAELEERMKGGDNDNKSSLSNKFGSTTSLTPSMMTSASSRMSLVSQTSTVGPEPPLTPNSFSDVFQLPPTENPVPLWQGGRRCTLVNKDRSLTAAFKIGRMYVTNNYLCFERYKSPSPKNLAISFESITRIDKAKLYHWLPGGGKAIEVKTKGANKTLVFVFQVHLFGTIVNRDEAFESIVDVGSKNFHPWAIRSREESRGS